MFTCPARVRKRLPSSPGFLSPWIVCFVPLFFSSSGAGANPHNVAYFNASLGSHVNISSVLNFRNSLAFSFRTCSGGELIQQNGSNGEFFRIFLNENGSLAIGWKSAQVQFSESVVLSNLSLADNNWYTVESNFYLGNLSLTIEQGRIVKANVLLASSTFRSYLWYLNLTGGTPLEIGSGRFTGCIQEGPQVLLSSVSVSAVGIEWDQCPLESTTGCGRSVVNPCWSYPCQNEGACVNTADDTGFRCQCRLPFTGFTCEVDMSNLGCQLSPCLNNATCQSTNSTTRNYFCNCTAGFTGTLCEINKNECVSNPCSNGGQCLDGINSFTCDCAGTGFSGKLCQTNIDECLTQSSSLCLNGATCMDTPGAYKCVCPTGYAGNNCQNQSNDCLSNPCLNSGTCRSSVGYYECVCALGFNGTNCELNIDDCAGIVCRQAHSVCVDGINSYTCQCAPGYYEFRNSADNVTCKDIDECLSNPCASGSTCINGENNFRCQCPVGFTGSRCETDIDECLSDPCQNDGTCDNVVGGYRCRCPVGYTDSNCSTEIDECDSRPCQNGATCIDLVGRFECNCTGGWVGSLCEVDIDECASQPCANGGSCNNLINRFTCTCASGFTGPRCEVNIDDCHEGACLNNGTCVDGIDSFTCRCTYDWMGPNCSMIYDACDLGICQNNSTCESQPPSHNYTCHCPVGFTGQNCEVNIDDCQNSSCVSYQVCIDGINSYTCSCPVGMTGSRCETDINECSSNPCLNGGTCNDGKGNYSCICNAAVVNLTSYSGNPKSVFRVGYSGLQCDRLINACAYSQPSICLNRGICQTDANSTYGFYCLCPSFTGQYYTGQYCHQLQTPCDVANRPGDPVCQNGGSCHPIGNDYFCSCAPGYTGSRCQTEINECDSDPCQYNGTCQDYVNRYTCQCQLGTTGVNCETNIDECASLPCHNGGQCIDLINGYRCNCSETGFQGNNCDVDIDECLSQPCQHNATCYNGIKMYNCSCFPGYNGTNCELDIDECLSSPCQHNATCRQRSDPDLPGFSFATAAGFDCSCSPGFTGVFCETDINECESSPCIYGDCEDHVNGYDCRCHPGYRGVVCETEINECLEYTPCQNNAACRDKVAGYDCICLTNEGLQQGKVFGGKNCSVELTGCRGNNCQNGATCRPILVNETAGVQGYTCQCSPGFGGSLCNDSTEGFFDMTSRLSYQLPDEDQCNTSTVLSISFDFRTTLHDVVLLYLEPSNGHDDYVLELVGSPSQAITLSNRSPSSFDIVLLINSPKRKALNDGNWHTVQLNITCSTISLRLVDPDCSPLLNCTNFLTLDRTSFSGGVVNFGGNISELTASDSSKIFVGCMQDIRVDDETFIPDAQKNFSYGFASRDVDSGCRRKEQCNPNPCKNEGQCVDLWTRFRCSCPRPFYGAICTDQHIAATFGYNAEKSFVWFDLPPRIQNQLESGIDISFFFRTRQSSGLLFYIGSAFSTNSTYMSLQMNGGQLWIRLKSQDIDLQLHVVSSSLADGQRHFVRVLKNDSLNLLRVTVESVSSDFSVNFSQPLTPAVFYVGGVPYAQTRNRREIVQGSDLPLPQTVANFEGTMQDLRVNGIELAFFASNGSDPTVISVDQPANMTNLQPGEVTSDVCALTQPCENNATCSNVFFNDFACLCDERFRGRNCSQINYCVHDACPSGGSCQNLEAGYECISNATFNGVTSMIHYSSELSRLNVREISAIIRTRKSGGVVVHVRPVSTSFCSIQLELFNGKVVLRFNLTSDGLNEQRLEEPATNNSVIDGSDHVIRAIFSNKDVQLFVDDDVSLLNFTERNMNTFDCLLLPDAVEFFVGGDMSSINAKDSEYFKGCLTEVRANGDLLSFFNESRVTNNTRYRIVREVDVVIGCFGDDVCGQNNQCKNGATCEDLWNAFQCVCPSGFTGVVCAENINDCIGSSCQNNATCLDGINSYSCTCIPGFTGTRCETNINECSSNPCQNGGTCSDQINKYLCSCGSGFVGLRCELPARDDCNTFLCQSNGTCVSQSVGPDLVTKKCVCQNGFTGKNCETQLDLCANNTCPSNTSSCRPVYETLGYACDCLQGYTGRNCLEDLDECAAMEPCFNNGTCVNRPGSYICNCPPNWMGVNCNEMVDLDGVLIPSGDLIPLIVGACVGSSVLILVIAIIIFLVIAQKKRATHGTYSPSRQEMAGSRVDMRLALKLPPEERLI